MIDTDCPYCWTNLIDCLEAKTACCSECEDEYPTTHDGHVWEAMGARLT